jgi:Mannosylglycerate hydrolase MGH1-like glycoside hydrolase domain
MKKCVLLLVIILSPLVVSGQSVSFSEGVTFDGWPSYVSEFQTAFRDNGGPLSPFGSHFGLKAEVRNLEFSGVEHYACMTGRNRFDYSRTGLVGVSSLKYEIDGENLNPQKRHITFDGFGWKETSKSDFYRVDTKVGFLDRNRYFIGAKFFNDSDKEVSVKPVFAFDGRAKLLNVTKNSSGASISFSVQPTTSMGFSHLALATEQNFELKSSSLMKGFEMTGEEVKVSAGGSLSSVFLFAFNPDSKKEAAQTAQSDLSGFFDIDTAWIDVLAETNLFLVDLPVPHVNSSKHKTVYYMAATASENSLYAPRNKMEHWAVVPTKVHYNWFWLWDSGLQSLSYANYDQAKAKDVVLTIFDAQEKDGFIAHMTDERLKSLTPHSQAPVFGYAVQKQIDRSGKDLDYIKEVYEKSSTYMDWWKDHRDNNKNGLFEWLSQDEGGWDDSPRMNYVKPIFFISYYGSLGELIGSRTKPLDAVDLNSWMYAYYESMSKWAKDLDRPDEAIMWKSEANKLADLIDNELWDDECGCWLDTYDGPGKKERTSFHVLTPHIWFPAFTGATRDEEKARTVIEKHLLNPDEFFGEYPIPTVAYNDPYFDVSKNTWKGSIWLVTAYSALEALFRFGYEDEALELKDRLLTMMADQDGMMGVYETYSPITGKYKTEGTTDSYSSAQFGWSAAFTMEIALDRYQEKRYVFKDDKIIQGFIRTAEDFEERGFFYKVDAGQAVPHLKLWSESPLLSADKINVLLTDPYGKLLEDEYRITIKGKESIVKLNRETEINL